jgi:hypothetical protein
MMQTRLNALRVIAVALVCLTLAPCGYAQDAPAAPSLIVERIPSGFVVAPDYKVTEVDDQIGQLAGAYAGRVTDDTLLIGGAAYWLANGSDDFKLAYGGLLIGWTSPNIGRIRFGARGLVGVGSATFARDIDGPFVRGADRSPVIRFGGRSQPAPAAPSTIRALGPPSTIRVRVRDDFFVVEPQANVTFNVISHIAVTGAAGYRAVALTDGLRDLLDGPTASLGLQFGW